MPEAPCSRIEEALHALRYKPVQSTTLERLHLTLEADCAVRDLTQPLQLGEGLFYLLDRISVPVEPHDLLVGRIAERVPSDLQERTFRQIVERWAGRGIPPWMRDGGHECFAWERLLALGLPGLEAQAAGVLRARRAQSAAPETRDFLCGAVRVYQAFRRFARRYARAATQANLAGPAAWCARIADHAPSTFPEALQLIWLVGLVYCTMLAQNPTLTFGRMDELLLPFYRRDVASGQLDRNRAGDLIEDFYCKNNLILGRGEHQMGGRSPKDTGWARNLTYDAPQYVVLGGRREDGAPSANELTALFLERVVPRFENPVIVIRYTADLPDAVWRLACRHMRANASVMVYNDANVVPAMEHSGVAPEHALGYTMHGCNWPDVPGRQRTLRTRFLELPVLLREILLAPDPPRTVDGIYVRLAAVVHRLAQAACDELRAERATWRHRGPGPLRVDDCFLDGPVDRTRSWSRGGVQYGTIVFAISGLGTTADSLAALAEAWPIDSARAALRRAMKRDYGGDEALRRRCLAAPKYGQDDVRADRHASRVLETVQDEIDRACRLGAHDQVIAFRCLETDMRHIGMGRETGATPDGRHAGEPVSENSSPVPGACTRGLTAMLRSVARLPLSRVHSGALNVRLQPAVFAGEEGLTRLAQALRTYMALGGLQVQLSMVDTAQLWDAQQHPDRHRDLMVRITGYSAAFVDMTRSAQDEIIRRAEMG